MISKFLIKTLIFLQTIKPEKYTSNYYQPLYQQSYKKSTLKPRVKLHKDVQKHNLYRPYTVTHVNDSPKAHYRKGAKVKAASSPQHSQPDSEQLISEYGLQHIHNPHSASYQYVKVAHVNVGNLPDNQIASWIDQGIDLDFGHNRYPLASTHKNNNHVNDESQHSLSKDGYNVHKYEKRVPEVYENAVGIVNDKLTTLFGDSYIAHSQHVPTFYTSKENEDKLNTKQKKKLTPIGPSHAPKYYQPPTYTPYNSPSYSPTYPSPYSQTYSNSLKRSANLKKQQKSAILNQMTPTTKDNSSALKNRFLRKQLQRNSSGSYSHQSFSW